MIARMVDGRLMVDGGLGAVDAEVGLGIVLVRPMVGGGGAFVANLPRPPLDVAADKFKANCRKAKGTYISGPGMLTHCSFYGDAGTSYFCPGVGGKLVSCQ